MKRINYMTGGNITQPASGLLFNLYINGKKIKAVLQDTINNIKTTDISLVDYKTGAIIADSKTIWSEVIKSDNFKRANGISDSDYKNAAESVFNKILEKHGSDRVIAVLNSAPIVNN